MSTCAQKMLSLLDKGRVKMWSFELYDCGICKKKSLCLEGKSDLHKKVEGTQQPPGLEK